MEVVTRASLKVCPFVKSASAQSLRQMSQKSGLANQARQCPFMNAALKTCEGSTRSYTTASKPVSATAASAASGGQKISTPYVYKQDQLAGHQVNLGSKEEAFDYDGFLGSELDKKRSDKLYRYFNNINRLAHEFPRAHRLVLQ